MSLIKRGMRTVSNKKRHENTGNFETKSKRRSHKSTKSSTRDLTPVPPKIGMCEGGTPSEGGESGSVGS